MAEHILEISRIVVFGVECFNYRYYKIILRESSESSKHGKKIQNKKRTADFGRNVNKTRISFLYVLYTYQSCLQKKSVLQFVGVMQTKLVLIITESFVHIRNCSIVL